MTNNTPLDDFIAKATEYNHVEAILSKVDALMASRDTMTTAAFNIKSHTLLTLVRNTYPEYIPADSVSMEGIGETITKIIETVWAQIVKLGVWLREKAAAIWKFLQKLFNSSKATVLSQVEEIKEMAENQNYKTALNHALEDAGLVFGDLVTPEQSQAIRVNMAQRMGYTEESAGAVRLLVSRGGALVDPVSVAEDVLVLVPIKVLKDKEVLQAVTVEDSHASTNLVEDLGRLYETDKLWSAYIASVSTLAWAYATLLLDGDATESKIPLSVPFETLTKGMIKNKEYYFGRMGLGNSCLSVTENKGLAVIAFSRSNKKFDVSKGKPATKVNKIPLDRMEILLTNLGKIFDKSGVTYDVISKDLKDLTAVVEKLKKKQATMTDDERNNVITVSRVLKELLESNVRRTQSLARLYERLQLLVTSGLNVKVVMGDDTSAKK